VLLNPSDIEAPAIHLLSNYTKNQGMLGENATAYICKNYSCNRPVTDADAMLKLLD
jgi:uncharacterized protein YyaL (SSP411 family)